MFSGLLGNLLGRSQGKLLSGLSGRGSIVQRLGSRLRGYFDPGNVSSLTYVRAARTENTGAAATSVYYSCPSNSLLNFDATGKFTVSFWYNPATFSGQDEILIGRSNLSTGWYIFAKAVGDGTYKLQFSIVGVYSKTSTSAIPMAGHIMVVVDTSQGTAANRVKAYNTDFATGITAEIAMTDSGGSAPASLASNAFPLDVGYLSTGAAYPTQQVPNGAFGPIQIWKSALTSGNAVTLGNSGTPLYHASLGALDNSDLVFSCDNTTAHLGTEATTRYTDSKNSLVLTPKYAASGTEVAVPNTQWLTSINLLGSASGSYGSPFFGRCVELLCPAVRSTATSDLFNKPVLKCYGFNSTTNSMWSAQVKYTGSAIGTLMQYSDGDVMMPVAMLNNGIGVGGIETKENFYLEAWVDTTHYEILSIDPTVDPGTPPLLPAFRMAALPTINGGVEFTNAAVNVNSGNRDIIHYGKPSGGAAYYNRFNLVDDTLTAGTLSTANSGGLSHFFGDAGTVTQSYLFGHEGTATLNAEIGASAWGIGWSTPEQTAMRAFLDAKYSPVATNDSYDADAVKYFTRVEAAGATIDSTKKAAISTWIRAGKSNKWWDKFADYMILGWGVEAACLCKVRSITPMTKNGSNFTWNTGYLTTGATSSLLTGMTPTQAGQGAGSCGYSILRRGTIGISGGTEIGSVTGGASSFLTLRFTGDAYYVDYGNGTTARKTSTGQSTVALYTSNCYSTTAQIFSRIIANGTQTTINSASVSGTAGNTTEIQIGNAGGTTQYAAGDYSYAAVRNARPMSLAQHALYETDTMTMAVALGLI